MPKKVFSFIPYYYSPHLETDIEIINTHVSAGDDVTVFVCSGELPACDANTIHDPVVCRHCVIRRRNGFNLINLTDKVHFRNFVNLKDSDLNILKQFQNVKVDKLEDLLTIQLEECLIGKTIYNELVSLKHETNPDMQASASYITNSIESCVLIYLSFKNHFTSSPPDIFYTFNGRFVVSHPAIAAARATGVNYAIHDRAGAINRFELVHNQSFHSVKYWNQYALEMWRDSKHTPAEKESIASGWFEERIEGKKQSWFSFTADQNIELPSSFSAEKTNITIFVSSEWEFSGVDEYKLLFYETQNQGLLRLAKDLERYPNIQIYLRVHPHLKDKNNSQTKFIAEQLAGKFSNFEVIPAESPIKSYELMVKSDAIVTFGSTVGIEASYKRVPSILIGRAWYEDLETCFIPKNHEELLDIIVNDTYKLSDEELDRRRINSLKYGYFSQIGGIAYSLFDQVDIFEMRYKGESISNQAPTYANGLKAEISHRLELKNDQEFNPLTSLVHELESALDSCIAENAILKDQIQAVNALPQPAAVDAASNAKPSLKRLASSLGKKFRKILN